MKFVTLESHTIGTVSNDSKHMDSDSVINSVRSDTCVVVIDPAVRISVLSY